MYKKIRKFEKKPCGHYFASSIADWFTGDDLGAVVSQMKRFGYAFAVYYVPAPLDASYDIEHFQPVVPGVVLIETYMRPEKK